MENFLPGFHQHHHHQEDPDEYGRHFQSRTGDYGVGPAPYTGQPVGFEHLNSPPKQRLSDMDPQTIAQLGYEGPEGERRKVDAINDIVYEREADRESYNHGVPRRSEGYEYREGYSDSYGHHDRQNYPSGRSSYPSGQRLSSYEDEEYRRGNPSDQRRSSYGDEEYRRGTRYSGSDPYGRPGYGVPAVPVQVDRTVEDDGTVVERVYPDSNVNSAFRPDHGKIHYGRQESFPETALQDAAYAHGRRRDYPGPTYPQSDGYAPPYSDATSSYGRRPEYDGRSSDYVDERDRRY